MSDDLTTVIARKALIDHPQLGEWLSEPTNRPRLYRAFILIYSAIEGRTADELGIVAASGVGHSKNPGSRTSLYAIHGYRSYLNETASGSELVRAIAATAITARTLDLVQAELAQEE